MTDSRGSVMVIEGGITGTLVEQSGTTVLVQEDTTRTDWEELLQRLRRAEATPRLHEQALQLSCTFGVW